LSAIVKKPVPIIIMLSVALSVSVTVAAAQSGALDFIINPNVKPLINGTIVNYDNKTYHILIQEGNISVSTPPPPPPPLPTCPTGFIFNTTSKECQATTVPPVVNETQPPVVIPPVVNDTTPCANGTVNYNGTCAPEPQPIPVPPPPVQNKTLKFIAVGDVENSKEGLAVFNQIKTRNADIVAVLGDLGYQSDLKWFKSTYGTLGNKVICVQGNHEAANEDGSTSLQTETLKYCGESFYVKKLGTVVFFGINTNGDLVKQLAGVKTLVTNTDFMNGIKSVHVLSHKPCAVPPNAHHPVEAKVKAFCDGVKASVPSTIKVYYDQAHNHVLSSSADGTYKTSGAGGKSHYTCPTTVTSAWWCNSVKYGFLEYVITPDGTTTSQFIDANGVKIN